MTGRPDDDRSPEPPGVLDALRNGWHALGGGAAEQCPGCPVCRLAETAGHVDPTTAAHLQAAAGHAVQAGRELLAALEEATRRPTPSPEARSTTASGAPAADATDQGTDQAPVAPERRRTIPVTRPSPEPTPEPTPDPTPAEEPQP